MISPWLGEQSTSTPEAPSQILAPVTKLRSESVNSRKISQTSGTLWQTSFYNFHTINEKKQGIQQNTPQQEFNKFTLRYTSDELERSFVEDFIRSSLGKVRLGLLLVLLFEILVGLLDIVKLGPLGHDTVSYLLIIRYAGICPLLALLGGFTFTRFYSSFMQLALALTSYVVLLLFFLQFSLTVWKSNSVSHYGVYYLTHSLFLLVYQFSW
jgi:hypothetical protein